MTRDDRHGSDHQDERRAVYYRRRRLAPQPPPPEPEVSPSDRLLDAINAGEVEVVMAIDRETGEPREFHVTRPRDDQ